jgi:hypothetical protein
MVQTKFSTCGQLTEAVLMAKGLSAREEDGSSSAILPIQAAQKVCPQLNCFGSSKITAQIVHSSESSKEESRADPEGDEVTGLNFVLCDIIPKE